MPKGHQVRGLAESEFSGWVSDTVLNMENQMVMENVHKSFTKPVSV